MDSYSGANAAAPGEPAERRSFSIVCQSNENSHMFTARNNRALPAARTGPGHTQQPPPCLVTNTIQGTLRWQLRGGTRASLLGAIPKFGYFRAASQQTYSNLEALKVTKLGKKMWATSHKGAVKTLLQNTGPEGQGFWWEAAMPWSYLSSNLLHNFWETWTSHQKPEQSIIMAGPETIKSCVKADKKC